MTLPRAQSLSLPLSFRSRFPRAQPPRFPLSFRSLFPRAQPLRIALPAPRLDRFHHGGFVPGLGATKRVRLQRRGRVTCNCFRRGSARLTARLTAPSFLMAGMKDFILSRQALLQRWSDRQHALLPRLGPAKKVQLARRRGGRGIGCKGCSASAQCSRAPAGARAGTEAGEVGAASAAGEPGITSAPGPCARGGRWRLGTPPWGELTMDAGLRRAPRGEVGLKPGVNPRGVTGGPPPRRGHCDPPPGGSGGPPRGDRCGPPRGETGTRPPI
eukprot:scaffold3672_cov104-Isochrysis_galbana.AAC.2